MKKEIMLLFLAVALVLVWFNRDPLQEFVRKQIYAFTREDIIVGDISTYNKSNDVYYVQETSDFIPDNYQELINVYYTILDNGWPDFSFYCDIEYEHCTDDVLQISRDDYLLSNINNFVHPFNTYTRIQTKYDSYGNISVYTEKTYTGTEILEIENKVNTIYSEIINDSMTDREKIKAAHDYIIDNSKYDQVRGNNEESEYRSDTAYGPLFEGYAVCIGYADAMQLFLEKMNLPNHKVASEHHVWNLVYVDDQWLHVDLTWDDPVISNGTEIIDHSFFLITTDELEAIDTGEHDFDNDIYIEASN